MFTFLSKLAEKCTLRKIGAAKLEEFVIIIDHAKLLI
jgi:hypothetical protein